MTVDTFSLDRGPPAVSDHVDLMSDGRDTVAFDLAAAADRLSVLSAKRRLLAEDLYAREAWADAVEIVGDDVIDRLSDTALLMIKPDAVAGRRIERILAFLATHNFEARAAFPLRLDRHSMRELWRYDWHVYPVARLRFCSFWYTACDVLAFAVADGRREPGTSAAARLSALKGNSIAARRSADSLRSTLQPPNQVLNFVHIADEPIDVVREAGILLDRSSRRAFFAAMVVATARTNVADAIAAVEATCPAHDLDAAASLDRLHARGQLGTHDLARYRRVIAERRSIAWDDLCAVIASSDDAAALWDFIVVASSVIPLERDPIPDLDWDRPCRPTAHTD